MLNNPLNNKCLMYKLFLFFSFVLVLFGGVSCRQDQALQPNECFPTLDTVTFSNHVFPLIQMNCATTIGCHAPGAGNPVLEDYSSVKAIVDNGSFENRVLIQQDMPPSYGPDSVQLETCELELMRVWVEQGALNN